MKAFFLLLVMLMLPQLAVAKVYMCRDAVTGKTTFTDRACEEGARRAEIRVPATNVDSGSKTAEPAPAAPGTWNSDRDTRKTGREHNALLAQENALRDEAKTAVAAVEEGS